MPRVATGSKVKAGSKVAAGSKVVAGSRAPRAVAPSTAPKKVYKIDCSPTAKVWTSSTDDEPLYIAQLREYLAQHVKIDGRAGVLGEKVKIEVRDSAIIVTSYVAFAKSYFKYLTKRFLKSKQLRQIMRVVASSKNAYQIRFFKLEDEAAE